MKEGKDGIFLYCKSNVDKDFSLYVIIVYYMIYACMDLNGMLLELNLKFVKIVMAMELGREHVGTGLKGKNLQQKG